MRSKALEVTSIQAPSADAFCAAVALFVGGRLGLPARFVDDLPWQERAEAFDRGDIDLCWMCGWPYAVRADRPSPGLELIAAPVMAGPRYRDQPVYFSDVVVRANSRFQSFSDLRGGSWAYNEPMSHSGYQVVRHFLATRNIPAGFFSSVVESGSHQASIDRVLAGDVDASVIDCTVLEALARARPEIGSGLRIIDTMGPSPAPPWVVRASLPQDLRERLRHAFRGMHESEEGAAILASEGVNRFAAVDDRFYDTIRDMAASGARAQL